MSATLICAGGSGAKTLESLLHLCAAGLGPEELCILAIDPDGSNGNNARVRGLVNHYQECQSAFGGKIGGELFFRTRLELLQPREGETGLNVWSPVSPNQRFSNLLNYPLLSEQEKDIVHLLFTREEREMEMNVGFRGHPAVGAAAMALLPLYRRQRPWNQLAQRIQAGVNQVETRVAIAGSVFGGTGASVLHPLTCFLRDMPQSNKERLLIGVLALAPYFHFDPNEGGGAEAGVETAARSEWFALATRAAAQFYQHLRENGDWKFDAMYWLGDDGPMKVGYCVGGQRQENPSHFIDLLAALACLDFFAGAPCGRCCYYAGPRECGEEEFRNKNVTYWDDLPLAKLARDTVRTRLLQFTLAGAVHLRFFESTLAGTGLERLPHAVPWYYDRFAKPNHSLYAPDRKKQIEALSSFWRDHHFPWWSQIFGSAPNRVRLLNPQAFQEGESRAVEVDLRRLANLLFPDEVPRHGIVKMDRFFADTVNVAGTARGDDGAPAYLAILAAASARFVNREYKRR